MTRPNVSLSWPRVYTPPQELSEKAFWETHWPALETAESSYEQALIAKFSLFTVIDFDVTKIQNKLGRSEGLGVT